MTLLREIQRDINDASIGLSAVLRKAKILARQLNDSEFDKWIEHELIGYDNVKDQDLPPYRQAITQSYGEFAQPYGTVKDVPLRFPADLSKEAFRWPVTMYFREGVSELEGLTKGRQGILQQDWPQDLVATYSRVKQVNCLRAYKVITSAQVELVLDSVRTRLLNFLLELEKIDPTAGEVGASQDNIPSQKLQQVFVTQIYGGNNILASGYSVHQTADQDVIGAKPDEIAKAFAILAQRLNSLPEGEVKNDAQTAVKALELEARKGKNAQEKTVRKWLSFLFETAPDIWEVAVDTFITGLWQIT